MFRDLELEGGMSRRRKNEKKKDKEKKKRRRRKAFLIVWKNAKNMVDFPTWIAREVLF